MPEKDKVTRDKIRIPIRTALMPVYYKDFCCIMGACQDNCCDCDWNIWFNKKDYLKLRRLEAPAEFKEKLDKTVRRLSAQEMKKASGNLYAKFQLDEAGQCPLHDSDGKCSLQKLCGEEVLPKVCRQYPRMEKRCTPAAFEYALSPSCEGVLQLLWNLPDGVDFIEEELPKSERGIFQFDMTSHNLRPWFGDIRAMCVDILQNRALSIRHRMLLLGLALQELRDMDWEKPELERWIERFAVLTRGDAAKEALSSLPGNRPMYLLQHTKNAIAMLNGVCGRGLLPNILELNQSTQSDKVNIRCDEERYSAFEASFRAGMGDIEYFFENLMIAMMLYTTFPMLRSKEALWKSYVALCNLYGFYRFAAVMGCGETPTKEKLFHILVNVSRDMLHNEQRQDRLRDEFFSHDSATLAHMAILLGE